MTKSLFLALGLLMVISGPGPAYAVELDEAQVEKLVKKAGVLDTKYSACQAEVNGHQITVKCTKSPKDGDKDCRINSVLIAKAIMEQDPSIDLVAVWFHLTAESWWIFRPTRATIGAYGTGQISEEQLLRMVPKTLYVEARTYETLMANSIGPGPYASERLYLLNYINKYSGRTKSIYPPLPTIDAFIPKFAELEEDARTGSVDEKTLARKIDDLKFAMNSAVTEFNKLPAAQRDAQILAYKRKHGLPVDSPSQKTTPGQASTVQISGGTGKAGNFTISLAQFLQLSKKYPEYTPNHEYKLELTRRQQAGLRLMQHAEAGYRRKEWSDMFSTVESAAKIDDRATLQPRLRSLETAIGLPSLPFLSK